MLSIPSELLTSLSTPAFTPALRLHWCLFLHPKSSFPLIFQGLRKFYLTFQVQLHPTYTYRLSWSSCFEVLFLFDPLYYLAHTSHRTVKICPVLQLYVFISPVDGKLLGVGTVSYSFSYPTRHLICNRCSVNTYLKRVSWSSNLHFSPFNTSIHDYWQNST